MIIRSISNQDQVSSDSIKAIILEQNDFMLTDNLSLLSDSQFNALKNKLGACEGKKTIIVDCYLFPSRLFPLLKSLLISGNSCSQLVVAQGKRKPGKRFAPVVAAYPVGVSLSGSACKHLIAELISSVERVVSDRDKAEELVVYALTADTLKVQTGSYQIPLETLMRGAFNEAFGCNLEGEELRASSALECLCCLKTIAIKQKAAEAQAVWLDAVAQSFFNKHGGEYGPKEAD